MKPTLRFRTYDGWKTQDSPNLQYFGMVTLIYNLTLHFKTHGFKMLEIGSYMGESTSMFASTGLFDEIHVIDPHEGYEEFNDLFGWTWEDVKKEWEINTRHYRDIIHLWNEYSYDIAPRVSDNYFDFIYIDGDHSYEGIKRDLELYLPKIKQGGVVAGHDYHNQWPGVMKAVNQTVGTPDLVFDDHSWIKYL